MMGVAERLVVTVLTVLVVVVCPSPPRRAMLCVRWSCHLDVTNVAAWSDLGTGGDCIGTH
jgi:hypothetical protein